MAAAPNANDEKSCENSRKPRSLEAPKVFSGTTTVSPGFKRTLSNVFPQMPLAACRLRTEPSARTTKMCFESASRLGPPANALRQRADAPAHPGGDGVFAHA